IRKHGHSSLLTRILGSLVVFFFILSLVAVYQQKKMMQEPPLSFYQDRWLPFNESMISKYLEEGKPVFVDITAEWCFTCKFNEKTVLNDSRVYEALKRKGVILMRADWTNRNE